MGLYPAEAVLNGNREKMIDFCIDNDILIDNTFFAQNDPQSQL